MLPLCLISGSVYVIPGSGTDSSLCRHRRRFILLPHGKAISKMLVLWPEWVPLGEARVVEEELCQPQDFGFRSGNGHMLLGAKWHPTLLERHGVRGQLHQYNLPDPTPWPLERSASLMYFGHWDASNSCMCHIYTMTVDRDKGKNAFFNVCETSGWLAQANPFFDASGEEAGSPVYCREMDGSRTCRGLLLAPRQSYQLRLNLSFWLL